MDLKILYEDNHLLVVVKPRGILSQEDKTKDPDMLNICKDYIKKKYNKPGNVYLGLVQRLDRNTSGVMVFAKTSKAASRLSEQIRNHDVVKRYLAIVEGNLKGVGTLSNYLKKDEKIVKSFVVNKGEGKLAVLDYDVKKNYKDSTLVEILLHTGRHHQIRVQFSNIGHPLKGDKLYGSKANNDYFLHCFYIAFVHPVTKQVLKFNYIPENLSL